MINHVYVDYGHGYAEGKYYAGSSLGNLIEAEISENYGRSLVEQLLENGLYHSVIESRVAPGLTDEERANLLTEKSIVVSCHVGAPLKPSPFNEAKIYIANEESRDLAEILRWEIERWGKITSTCFRQARILKASNPILKSERAYGGILLEPFQINCGDATKFAGRLDALGTRLGRAIVDYVRLHNPAAGVQPLIYTGKGVKKF